MDESHLDLILNSSSMLTVTSLVAAAMGAASDIPITVQDSCPVDLATLPRNPIIGRVRAATSNLATLRTPTFVVMDAMRGINRGMTRV